ncbi:MAG: sigma factor-like helix-turn-helix DNA-binding protein, partial [Vicinamibacterales bacterium]
LSQRHVDRLRERKRTEPIPDDESPHALAAHPAPQDPERLRFVGVMHAALATVLAVLSPKDRLRLACYYAQQMTLAQVGRLLGEHEATVSRQLSKTRATIRGGVEERLCTEHGLGEAEIAECFASLAADAGPLDLAELLATTESPTGVETSRSDARKISGLDRSNEGGLS